MKELLGVATREDLPFSYRTEWLQAFFHLTVDAQVRVQHLTKLKSVKRLLSQFAEHMEALHVVSERLSRRGNGGPSAVNKDG